MSSANDRGHNGMDNVEAFRSESPDLHPLMASNTPSVVVEMSNRGDSNIEKEKNSDVFTNLSTGGGNHLAGIDDGFLTPGDNNGLGGGGDNEGPRPPSREREDDDNPGFPMSPGFPRTPNHPSEPGNIPRGRGGVDINVYAHKKTLAQGMMDLALLSANANQLRYVLDTGSNHPYFYVGVVLISLSIILQLAVGIGLILNSRYNIRHIRDVETANRINNFTVLGIFLVTMLNVFISAFGVGDIPTTTPDSPPERLVASLATNCSSLDTYE